MDRRRCLSVVVMAAISLSCAARRPGDPIRPGFNVYSKQQDIQLGQEAAGQIRKQVRVVDNRDLQDYVSRLGQRLAGQPEADGYPYNFTLIHDDSINAFALPGGPIFVHTGLMAASDNEAQFVGVLAHEIAHVALRHGTSQASKATLIQLPAVLGGVALGQGSVLAQLGQLGIGLGANSILLKYSRDAENQADALGARMMAKAGWNPVEMASFFEKLEAQGGSRAPQFLSSHPNPGNRVRNVQAEVQTLPQANYNADTGQFSPMREQVARLGPGRPPAQQAAAGAPARSALAPANFTRLQTSRVGLDHPAGWQVYGDRTSAVVTIAPQGGIVQGRGGFAITHGAVLSYYRPESGRRDVRGATQELLRDLASINPDLRAAGPARTATLGGQRGMLVPMAGRTPDGAPERIWLATINRPEGLFYLVLISPDRDFATLEPAFRRMLDSVQFN
jgi:beta-barrel assembly-enhancing protease